MSILEKLNGLVEPASGYIAIAAVIVMIVSMVISIILLVRYKLLKYRLDCFMKGTKQESMEELLKRVVEDNQRVKIQLKNNTADIAKVNENLMTAYRKIGIVKFNAFPGIAGKVSSSICLLNNENNGLIIETIHGQEGCYTYVKEIMNGKSINPLTKEDEDALKIALEMQI